MRGKRKLITDVAVEPVTLNQMKDWLSIDSTCTEFDAMLTAQLPVARRMVEDLSGYKLGLSTVDFLFPSFSGELWLEQGGVDAVTYVKYYDGKNELQTLETEAYVTQLVEQPAMVFPEYNYTYPVTYTRWDAVQVRVTTGATGYPQPLLTALRMIVAHWFENRQSVVIGHGANEIPLTSRHIIEIYKLHVLR